MHRSGSKYRMSLAAMLALGGVGGMASRAFRWPKPEKYPGQRRAYLIGASSVEGEKYRAWKAEQGARP